MQKYGLVSLGSLFQIYSWTIGTQMFEFTSCNFPTLYFTFITLKNGIIPIGLIIGFYIVGISLINPKGILESIGNLVFAIVMTIMISIMMLLPTYIKGGTTQDENKIYIQYLETLKKESFTDEQKAILMDFAQCSTQDGDLSKFEYEQFEYQYLKFKNSNDLNSAINQTQSESKAQD